jgi:serine/threonine protein kinase/WD40 repeat protein
MKPNAQRVRDVFVAAVDLPPDQWQAFLKQTCAGDEDLRRQVSRLLEAHQQPGSFLDQPVAHVQATGVLDPTGNGAATAAQERPGTRIGPYELLERIGEGGMGEVWMAEQREPIQRQVALKIIKAGMGTRSVVARFEAERQALALMDHPNIARVLDAGTTGEVEGGGWRVAGKEENESLSPATRHAPPATRSGRPYFVMELVHGVPITDYCDREQLSIPERVELFVLVCRAVQHAHQKGVIHRDLKPSNILVTVVDGVAVPKVIDFGVAKATGASLTERIISTSVSEFIGTPLYVSPEQAGLSGMDIDTRSDIYSLGVLLYELLTGTTPFDRDLLREAAFDEILRIVREQEPPRPSTRLSELSRPHAPREGSVTRSVTTTLTPIAAQRHTEPAKLPKLVRGELDWIVMKALEKDRNRRYESADALADDVRDYLDNKPIKAGPPSTLYRLRKFARRNRLAFATTSVVLLTLLIASGVSTWQALRAHRSAKIAITQRNRAIDSENPATAQARKSQRESLIQQVLRILSTPHTYGWSRLVEDRVHEAARLGPDEDHSLQGYAAASLSGLDARRIKQIPIATATLAFDPAGKTLYLCDTNGQAWVWDGSANPVRKIGAPGEGLFAFRPDGTAVQLRSGTKDEPRTIELRALEPAKTLRQFRSPIGPGSIIEATALTPDARLVAATIRTKEHRSLAVVWNGETGDVVRQLEIANPTALALAPDGRWVAVATTEGEVAVWSLPEGDLPVRFTVGRVKIATLASAPDRLRRTQPAKLGEAWLLAVGDVATGLTVFDLSTHSIRSQCRGSNYDVGSVAFSPDGMLLASAGRREPVLWDIWTGLPVLRLAGSPTANSIVFSPDGKQIAVSSQNASSRSAAVEIYELKNGRGLQTLWGLDAQIAKTALSKDGRLVAALAQDFRVGIWDRGAGQLLHVLEVPIGVFTDNAGLAFSPDGRRFVYAAGTQGRMWDVATGAVVKSWKLPAGFQDNLAFDDGGRLISARVETTDPSVPPHGTDAEKYPRVLRIRNLSADAPQLLAEIPDFNQRVFHSELTRDGRSLLVEGRSGPKAAPARLVKAFDIAGNRDLWAFQDTLPEIDAASFHFDPTGRVYFRRAAEGGVHVVEFPSRALFDSYERGDARGNICCLSPGGQLFLSGSAPNYDLHKIGLWAPRQETPLLTITSNVLGPSASQFSPGGRFAVWGNPDGTVTVFELEEVQRRLARFGLGW